MVLDDYFDGSKFEPESRTFRAPHYRESTLPLVRRLMKMLDAGYYPARIAELLGKSKGTIAYHIKKLLECGFIEKTESLEHLKDGLYVKRFRGVITLYKVTHLGSNFLAGIERRIRGRVLRLHNAYFKYPILRQPRVPVVWRKVELTNWTQLLGRELGLRVRKNPGSIEVIASVVEGKDPYRMLFRAREEADSVAKHLEGKFGMVLGRSSLSRRPHFGIYDPVANEFSKFFELSDDVGKIDESEGYGEVDLYSPETAKEYLLMPLRVRELEKDMTEIKDGQRLFSEGMVEHMKMIKEVRALVEELRNVVPGLAKRNKLRARRTEQKKTLNDFM